MVSFTILFGGKVTILVGIHGFPNMISTLMRPSKDIGMHVIHLFHLDNNHHHPNHCNSLMTTMTAPSLNLSHQVYLLRSFSYVCLPSLLSLWVLGWSFSRRHPCPLHESLANCTLAVQLRRESCRHHAWCSVVSSLTFPLSFLVFIHYHSTILMVIHNIPVPFSHWVLGYSCYVVTYITLLHDYSLQSMN